MDYDVPDFMLFVLQRSRTPVEIYHDMNQLKCTWKYRDQIPIWQPERAGRRAFLERQPDKLLADATRVLKLGSFSTTMPWCFDIGQRDGINLENVAEHSRSGRNRQTSGQCAPLYVMW